jgi:Protein of unknown function (DUF3810)
MLKIIYFKNTLLAKLMLKKIKYSLLFSIPIQYFIYSIIENNTNWVENFYIKYVFSNLALFLRKFTNIFNFSVGFLMLYLFLGYLLFVVFKNIFLKKHLTNWKNSFLNIGVCFSIFYFLYMILWGLAYHRKPIAEILNINTSQTSQKELVDLCEYLLEKTNETRNKIPNNVAQSTEIGPYLQKSIIGYKYLEKENLHFTYKNESIKKVIGSNLLSYLNTAGIYTFWSGEANINTKMLAFEAPFVTCHEMAHQIGFASETEANFVSYKACLKNPAIIYHYSAYSQSLSYGLRALWQSDSTKAKLIYNRLSSNVMSDKIAAEKIRLAYNLPIVNKFSGYLYDLFLKSNNQNEGIKSYGLMVDLLIGERRKNTKK